MAERLLLSLENASFRFGGKPVFDDTTIHILDGDKICLIGRNGAGKTTLMKLITGQLELHDGKRFVFPGLTIGYLAQQVPYQEQQTVRDFVLDGLPRDEHWEEKRYLADMMMTPLDLNGDATMGTLSGGQVRRAALAQCLVASPDVLLLDEPTNHLDLQAITWLEQYLGSYRGAILCVSHDRTFLKNISQKVFWLDRGTIRTCPKGYAGFEEWAGTILEQEARELHNMGKKLQAEVDWTQGGVTGRRKRNQRRLRELHRLREQLRKGKESYRQTRRTIELEPLPPSQASKIIAEFRDVSHGFVRDGVTIPVMENFHGRVMRGDRIGILGKNGAGKSTFIKLLLGELQPDSGHIRRGKTMEVAYFDQHRVLLNPKKTVQEILCPDGGDYVFLGNDAEPKPIHVCGYLKNFLFDPRLAREVVATLSGGQQNRLMLAKVLAQPGNVLILDEPTNDLDMDTLDMLEEILGDYQGTLLLVSHDRDFLDRIVSRVLAFEGNGIVESHVGGYSDYLAYKQAQVASSVANSSNRTVVANANAETVSSRPVSSSGKLSFKLKYEWEQLPSRITALEKEIALLEHQLADNTLYARDAAAFDKASRRLPEAKADLEAAEMRWLELDEMQQAG